MDKRTNNGTKGLNADEDAWNSVVVSLEIDNHIQVKLYPIELGFELPRYIKGLPRLSGNSQILGQIKKLSEHYDTEIQIVNGVGILNLSSQHHAHAELPR
jgi:poly-gamma-glutamate synthesis protein (capsule biosynthesis protein)